MEKIIFATNNPHKLAEFKQLLDASALPIIAQNELNISEANETGLTFVENAIIKARHACSVASLPAIADDSGLEVDLLDGAPGVYSARYAGSGASSSDNIAKLLNELGTVQDKVINARFHCCMVYLEHKLHPAPFIAYGVWEGQIICRPQGVNGFGYDPIFWVSTHNCTAAELPIEIKNQISHRALAARQLIAYLHTLINKND